MVFYGLYSRWRCPLDSERPLSVSFASKTARQSLDELAQALRGFDYIKKSVVGKLLQPSQQCAQSTVGLRLGAKNLHKPTERWLH